MKTRQLTFRQTGGTAFGKAQYLAFRLRSTFDTKGQAYYAAEEGIEESPAGMWASTVYLMTDAPLPVVRKLAVKEGLTLNLDRPGRM